MTVHKFIALGMHPLTCARCGKPKSHVSHVTKGHRRPRIHWDRIFKSQRKQWKVYS